MNHPWHHEWVMAYTALLCESHQRLTGRELLPACHDDRERAQRLFDAPFVVVSHGTEPDPILNYGNAAALALWEMSWDDLRRTPSRLTAEAPERAERSRLLEAVATHGFIADYAGIRISSTGRRFRIHQATVWNLVAPDGRLHGQAATFSQWEMMTGTI